MDHRDGFKLLGTMVFPGVIPEPIEQIPAEEVSSDESSVSCRSIVIYIQPQPIQMVAPADELWPEFKPQLRGILLSLGVSMEDGPVHIFTKTLFFSDINKNLARLLIPKQQIKVKFLSDYEEDELLGKERLDVKVIDPSLIVRDMKLSRWNYGVHNSTNQLAVIVPNSTSYAYSLNHKWMNVVDSNGLVENDTVQIWTFRFDGGSIGMIIIKEVQETASSSSSGSGISTVSSWGGKRKRGSNFRGRN